jgi:hypothetical protein
MLDTKERIVGSIFFLFAAAFAAFAGSSMMTASLSPLMHALH